MSSVAIVIPNNTNCKQWTARISQSPLHQALRSGFVTHMFRDVREPVKVLQLAELRCTRFLRPPSFLLFSVVFAGISLTWFTVMLLEAPAYTLRCWDTGPHLRAEDVVFPHEDLDVFKCGSHFIFTFLVAWDVEDNSLFCASSLPLESTWHIYW